MKPHGFPAALIVLLVLVVPLPTLGQTPTPTDTRTASAGWEDEVRAMLNRRAEAVMRGDEKAFLATMNGAPEAFRRDRVTWLRRLRALPLGTYRLDFTQEEFGELTRAVDRARHPAEVHVIQVKERIGFRGYDAAPAAEDVYLTVVKRGSEWAVVADDDAETLALQSNRNLWDFGPVSKLESDGIMVVYHPAERAAAPRLLALAKSARATVRKVWPLPWRNDEIVLMIPSTVDELARILQTTFDLSTFIAFAGASVDRASGWRLTGPRIFLHWPNFRRVGEGFQRITLQHEFLHHATRELSGVWVTSIIEEGVAQYYGEEAYNPPTPELRQRVRAGRFTNKLVEDFIFTVGPPSDIYLAYEEGVDLLSYIGDRFGRGAGARLYRALSAESPISPGTWRYHLDRACRSALGIAFATLERDWARRVVRELS